jgi:hypothetical protein
LVEYEQHYLPSLPIYLKEALLSYLSIYGEKGCLSLESLKILFAGNAEVEGGSGSEEIRFLDLTGLLDPKYNLVDLKKSFPHPQSKAPLKPPSVPSVTSAMEEVSLTDPKGKKKAPAEVVESWEDELDETTTTAPLLPTLSIPLFPNLTRLSLAHPGETASWADLLAVSPRLKTLTHLSLAYWPTPSTTPNAATASMVSKHTNPVALGGSHFYSELDDDWHEAANILRRLSKNTYCLKWLDLEGCTWHKALTWDQFEQIRTGTGLGAQDNWLPSAVPPGPDWNAAWRQVEYVNISQGWIPGDAQSLRTMPAGVIPVQLLRWLREHGEDPEYRDKLRMDCGYEATQWVEREKVGRSVALEIQSARKRVEGKWCKVDQGWEPVPGVQRRRGSEESV